MKTYNDLPQCPYCLHNSWQISYELPEPRFRLTGYSLNDDIYHSFTCKKCNTKWGANTILGIENWNHCRRWKLRDDVYKKYRILPMSVLDFSDMYHNKECGLLYYTIDVYVPSSSGTRHIFERNEQLHTGFALYTDNEKAVDNSKFDPVPKLI